MAGPLTSKSVVHATVIFRLHAGYARVPLGIHKGPEGQSLAYRAESHYFHYKLNDLNAENPRQTSDSYIIYT